MKIKSKKDYMIDFFKDKKNHNREFTLAEYDSEVKKAYEAETGSNKIYTNRTPRNLIRYGDQNLDGILKTNNYQDLKLSKKNLVSVVLTTFNY